MSQIHRDKASLSFQGFVHVPPTWICKSFHIENKNKNVEIYLIFREILLGIFNVRAQK